MSGDRTKGFPGPTVIQQLLARVQAVNRRAGFLAWDPEKIAADPVGDPGLSYPRLTPPTPASPRLFISYTWSGDVTYEAFETDVWVDAFAGFLFNCGYDIVFDRDPRNFGKNLSALALVMRMNDCNYFVPIINEEYVERISSPQAAGAAVMEWKHARSGFPQWFTFIGIWRSGLVLPEPLTLENTIDVRNDGAPWADEIAEMFPPAALGKRGIPRLPAPVRPPDPPDWPKFRPYETQAGQPE